MDNNDYNLDWWFIAVMDDGGNGDIAIVISEVMVIQNEQWWMTAMKMAIVLEVDSIAIMIEWSIFDSGWMMAIFLIVDGWWQLKYWLMDYGNTGYRVMHDNREVE